MMRVLIVGLGSIAQKHIDALLFIDKQCEIFAFRSTNNGHNISNVTNLYNFEELPVNIDFAIISNPTHLHYKFISLLADLNIPLFIEKPMVHELLGLDKLISKLISKNIFTYVACNLRFHPCLQYLNNFIKSDTDIYINEVNVYCGSYLPDWRPNKNFRIAYSANSETGGGVHLDLFHEIDYIIWIFGLPKASSIIKTSNSSLKINAVDYANYCLKYNTFTTNIVLNYYRKVPKRTLELIFNEDVWVIDLIKNKITNSNNQIVFEDNNFSIKDTYKMQLAYFIENLKERGAIMNTAIESAVVLKICLTDEY